MDFMSGLDDDAAAAPAASPAAPEKAPEKKNGLVIEDDDDDDDDNNTPATVAAEEPAKKTAKRPRKKKETAPEQASPAKASPAKASPAQASNARRGGKWYRELASEEAAKHGILIVDTTTRDPSVPGDASSAADLSSEGTPAASITPETVLTLSQLSTSMSRINITMHGSPTQMTNAILTSMFLRPTKESLARAMSVCIELCISGTGIHALSNIAFTISYMYPQMLHLVSHCWLVLDNVKKLADDAIKAEGNGDLDAEMVRRSSFARAGVKVLATFWTTWNEQGSPAPQTTAYALLASLRNPDLYSLETFPNEDWVAEQLQKAIPHQDLEQEIEQAAAGLGESSASLKMLLRLLWHAMTAGNTEIAVRTAAILFSLGCGMINKRHAQGDFATWPDKRVVHTPMSNGARTPYTMLRRSPVTDTPIGLMWLAIFRFIESKSGMVAANADAMMMTAHVSFRCYSLEMIGALLALICSRVLLVHEGGGDISWAPDEAVDAIMKGNQAYFYSVLTVKTFLEVVDTVPHCTPLEKAFSELYKKRLNTKGFSSYLRRLNAEDHTREEIAADVDKVTDQELADAFFPHLDPRVAALVLEGVRLRRRSAAVDMVRVLKPALDQINLGGCFTTGAPPPAAGGRKRARGGTQVAAAAAVDGGIVISLEQAEALRSLYETLGQVLNVMPRASAPAAKPRARAPAAAKRRRADPESSNEYSSTSSSEDGEEDEEDSGSEDSED